MNSLKKHQETGNTVVLPAPEQTGGVEPEDGVLVEKAKEGDTAAFEQIVSRYERFVLHVAQRALRVCGGQREDSEDVAQMAFLKAWRSLDSFRGECAFSSWLYRIVVNCARDVTRSQNRHPTVSLTQTEDDGDEAVVADIPVSEGDEVPESALERQEVIRQVRRAIESLPLDMRQVIILRDLEELTYSQISDLLGVEVGTVKSRINRGRQLLKKHLSGLL